MKKLFIIILFFSSCNTTQPTICQTLLEQRANESSHLYYSTGNEEKASSSAQIIRTDSLILKYCK